MHIPYGAVYFRKSNPPREDWERDYQTASEDGLNIFRHWFMWGSIEVAPGKYDWGDYDRQLDLAEKYGIKTIIAEMLTMPEWLVADYPEILYRNKDGIPHKSYMGGSSSTGGWRAGPCLDTPLGKEMAGNFLLALANRYKRHPALYGYDIWNECNYAPDVCYCADTVKAYREWLKNKYKDIGVVSKLWHRYSYASFDHIQPPPSLGLYPEVFDWMEFRKENFYAQMQWRIDLIRSVDTDHLIAAHGTADSLNPGAAMSGNDDWAAASKVEIYGFTWVASRRGSEPWKQFHAVDVVRAGCRDKTFWHAEMQGGPLWLQPQVLNRPREDGRISRPCDIRIWNFVSLIGGTRGFLNPRWRPLLDGPLFGAFGAYGMDGSRTPNSNMASSMAKWMNDPAQDALMKARPVKGDIGILFVPETQRFSYMLSTEGKWNLYSQMLWGAYKAFFDNNIQADWVHLDDIDQYSIVYLPYPVMLTKASAEKLKDWVNAGGQLISEGCPGYFGDGGTAGTRQPNTVFGFDEFFGVKQTYVEFVPDILTDMEFSFLGRTVSGGTFVQTYACDTAVPCGYTADGAVIAARNRFGKGEALLIGTFPSEAYHRKEDAATKSFFDALLPLFGREQMILCSDSNVKVRIQKNGADAFLWALNMGDEPAADVKVYISQKVGKFVPGHMYYKSGNIVNTGANAFELSLPMKDAIIFKLDSID